MLFRSDCDLQVPEGRVVKGVEFKQIKYAGNPVDLATRYYEEGADEVVVLDITASHERRATMADVIDRLTENVFMPICVGGGIRKVTTTSTCLRRERTNAQPTLQPSRILNC